METPAILALECCAAAGAAGALALWWGLRHLRRARELEDTPLSRIRSAAQGQVELLGRARMMPGPTILSPLTNTPCVWWQCRVWQSHDDRTVTIYDATSDDLFYLSDTTGDCIVDPVGAAVQPDVRRTWRGHQRKPMRAPQSAWDALLSSGPYRYSERLLSCDSLLTASGWFRTQAAVQAADESRDLAALLGEWKRDRASLLRRFDANRDGRIDPQEWETARAAALEEIRSARAEQKLMPDFNVLGKPPDDGEFRLSAVPPQEQRRRYRLRGRALVALGAAALLAVLLVAYRQGWL